PQLQLEFAYYLQTDGVSVSVQFDRRRLERYPSSKRDFRLLPRELDLSTWQKGIYHLNKEPRGLDEERLAQSRIIGVDP
ncbi:hypothetical protein DFQ28_004937, partial [Apophysomyces sp. BC1034]